MIEPPPVLEGEAVLLRPLTVDDVPTLVRWFNDRELRDLIGEIHPLGAAELTAHLARIAEDPWRRWYGIVERATGRLVGEGGLLRIVPEWRCADMSLIFGEPDARGRGLGTEAGNLIADLAFRRMGLHRLAIGVVGFNRRALRFWRRIGFIEEGVQRDGYHCRGAFHDFVMMCRLADPDPL